MTARRGQVAIYLACALVALTLLILMNVGAYLAVSARNHAMNAGDAAALAVAKRQGDILNQIGQLNLDHLNCALNDDEEGCARTLQEQLRLSLLEPVHAIAIGNHAAEENGIAPSEAMRQILTEHVSDIRSYYEGNPDLYPEAWPGAWEEYARAIEAEIANGISAGPDNIVFMDEAGGHYLINRWFYQAIAGRTWCWFHFNAPGLLTSYNSFRDWAPLPSASDEIRRRRCVNSEIYSLNLCVKTGSAIGLLGVELLVRLTGESEEKIKSTRLLKDPTQTWFFYDESVWRNWWEIDPAGEWQFPVMGSVKPEYNVLGCAAVCRVSTGFQTIVTDSIRTAAWSAAAKPFGTVEGEGETVDVVTALKGFVTPSFTDTRLVPLDSVGGKNYSTADPDWMEHVMHHLDPYLRMGTSGCAAGCWYCTQLRTWERESFRREGARWLKYHAGECRRTSGHGGGRGGTPHGH